MVISKRGGSLSAINSVRSTRCSRCYTHDLNDFNVAVHVAVHLDVRNSMFQSDLLGEDKLTQNLQVGLGVTAFF